MLYGYIILTNILNTSLDGELFLQKRLVWQRTQENWGKGMCIEGIVVACMGNGLLQRSKYSLLTCQPRGTMLHSLIIKNII